MEEKVTLYLDDDDPRRDDAQNKQFVRSVEKPVGPHLAALPGPIASRK
jgi:hypothetical protein